jgi:hypothetical protein
MPGARVSGFTCVDVDSRVPIAHVRVVSLSATPLQPLVSDSQGDVLVDVPDGGRTVRVSKAGYAPESVQLKSGSDVVDVSLARGAAIAGRLLDPFGAPVVGRAVRASLVEQQGAAAAVAHR